MSLIDEPSESIGAAALRKNLSTILDKVEGGERFTFKRDVKEIGVVLPADDFHKLRALVEDTRSERDAALKRATAAEEALAAQSIPATAPADAAATPPPPAAAGPSAPAEETVQVLPAILDNVAVRFSGWAKHLRR